MATEEPLTVFDDGTFHIGFVQEKVTIDREPVNLKPPEYRLLATLALHRGEVFTPEKLMELFAGDPDSTPDTVAYTLMCVRTKLGQKGAGELIETVRGFGFVYRSQNR